MSSAINGRYIAHENVSMQLPKEVRDIFHDRRSTTTSLNLYFYVIVLRDPVTTE